MRSKKVYSRMTIWGIIMTLFVPLLSVTAPSYVQAADGATPAHDEVEILLNTGFEEGDTAPFHWEAVPENRQ